MYMTNKKRMIKRIQTPAIVYNDLKLRNYGNIAELRWILLSTYLNKS